MAELVNTLQSLRDRLLDSLENILDKDDSIIMSQERPHKDLSPKELAEKLSEWHHKFKDLCGIDDKGPGEREIMEAAENHALSLIKP